MASVFLSGCSTALADKADASISAGDGTAAAERNGDHSDSVYYAHPDIYNLQSTDTLTVLHHFQTQQQDNEWSCGINTALMVMNDYPDGIISADIVSWLKQEKPIMVCWNLWGGHWQVIIGYDTMGTEIIDDDVILMADSADTYDHCNDGYEIFSEEVFMDSFTMNGRFHDDEGGSDHLFIVASPK